MARLRTVLGSRRRERVRRLGVEPPPAARWLQRPEPDEEGEQDTEKAAPPALITQGVRSLEPPRKRERRDWLRQAAGF